MERTLVLIKPDAMERLMGEIISIYEKKGFHISAQKMVKPTRKWLKSITRHKEQAF